MLDSEWGCPWWFKADDMYNFGQKFCTTGRTERNQQCSGRALGIVTTSESIWGIPRWSRGWPATSSSSWKAILVDWLWKGKIEVKTSIPKELEYKKMHSKEIMVVGRNLVKCDSGRNHSEKAPIFCFPHRIRVAWGLSIIMNSYCRGLFTEKNSSTMPYKTINCLMYLTPVKL